MDQGPQTCRLKVYLIQLFHRSYSNYRMQPASVPKNFLFKIFNLWLRGSKAAISGW